MENEWWFLIYLLQKKSNFLLYLWLQHVSEPLKCVRTYRSSPSIVAGIYSDFWNFKYFAWKKNADCKFLHIDSKNCHSLHFLWLLGLRVVIYCLFSPTGLKLTFSHYTFSQYLKAYLCKYQELLGLPATGNLTPKWCDKQTSFLEHACSEQARKAQKHQFDLCLLVSTAWPSKIKHCTKYSLHLIILLLPVISKDLGWPWVMSEEGGVQPPRYYTLATPV